MGAILVQIVVKKWDPKKVQKWSENGHAGKTPLDPGGPLKEEKRQLKADNTDKRRGGPDTLSVPSGTVADYELFCSL